MKNYLFLLASLFISFLIAQQAPEIEWSKNYGGSGLDKVHSAIKDLDGGYVMVGETTSRGGNIVQNENLDGLLIKINQSGEIIWQKKFGNENDEFIADVSAIIEGGYILGANSHSIENNYDLWIINLDASGEMLWENRFGGSDYDVVRSIIQTTDGGFLVSGFTHSNDGDIPLNRGYGDVWILKLNQNGELEWQKTYGGSESEGVHSAQQTSDGGYIIAGYTSSVDGDVTSNIFPENAWVVKLNQRGELIWEKSFGEILEEDAYKIKELSDGNFVFVGYKGDGLWTYSDAWVVKIDQQGNTIWDKTFGGSSLEIFYDFFENPNGDLSVSGVTFSQNGDVNSYHKGAESWVVKLNSSGELLGGKTYGGNDFDDSKIILQTDDSKILLVGTSKSQDGDIVLNQGMEDFWAFKINPDQMSTTENEMSKITIHPNPVKNILNFSEKLNQIEIYNLSGMKLMNKSEGQNINVDKLPTGTYILKAKNQKGETITQKFIKK